MLSNRQCYIYENQFYALKSRVSIKKYGFGIEIKKAQVIFITLVFEGQMIGAYERDS